MNTSLSLSTLFLFISLFRLDAQQWERVSVLPAQQMSALLMQGDTFYVAGLNKIYFTNDHGNNWDSTAIIDPALDYITALRVSPGRLYVSTLDIGVWSSADHGQTWQPDNAGLSGLGAINVSSLAIRGDSLYAGTYGSGVFLKNMASNSNWSPYNLGMPWSNVESITNIGGRLFAGSGGNATVSLQTAPGHTWTETPFAPVNGDANFFLGVVQHDNVLLAAGNYGLYRSTDGGLSWTHFNAGTGFIGLARFAVTGQRVIAQLVKPSGFSLIRYTDDGGLT